MKQIKSGKFSKILVASIVITNIIFTIAVLWIFLQTGSEPMTLIGAWFAFTTGELWMLAGIKKAKIKEEKIKEGGQDHES